MSNFSRCPALNNIPKRKLTDILNNIDLSTTDLNIKNTKLTVINRYAESNIPIEYWDISMEKNFKGDSNLLDKYNQYITDLKLSYTDGKSICLIGQHGVGKSLFSTSVLKKASQKGFSCQYSDMSNIVSVLTQASSEDKFLAKRELILVDFLVIDEMDPRFFNSSDASTELFAKNFENIFRTRRQNKLPTIICTNSPNLTKSFIGPLQESLTSLFSDKIEMCYISGTDYRKKSPNE